MYSVYKYEIPVIDDIDIEMPEHAQILCVQVQRETPCIWALVDNGVKMEKRSFRLAGTGHEIEFVLGLEYIGTFQLYGGSFVGHLFEKT